MGGIRRLVGLLTDFADLVSGLILFGVTMLNIVAVFMRYVMHDSIPWSEEIIRYSVVWLTFLAASAVSWRREHLALELLTAMGGPLVRRLHRAALHLLAVVFCVFVVWQGVNYCLRSGMQTAPASGMLMLYVYGAIVVGGALMLIAEFVRMIDALTLPLDDPADSDPEVNPS